MQSDAEHFAKLRPTVYRFRCSDCGSEHVWSRAILALRSADVPKPTKINAIEDARTLALPVQKVVTRASPQRQISQIVHRLLGSELTGQSNEPERRASSFLRKR